MPLSVHLPTILLGLITVAMIFVVIATALFLSNRAMIARRVDRRVVTPLILFGYANSVMSFKNDRDDDDDDSWLYHLVYDFTKRRIVLLRTNGLVTVAHRYFPIPDTRRYHVRFPSVRVSNSRYSEYCRLLAKRDGSYGVGDEDLRLTDLVDVVNRPIVEIDDDDIEKPLKNPLKSWGGLRLRFRLDDNGVISLRFGDAPRDTLRLRVPTGVDIETETSSDGSIRLHFRPARTLCADPQRVRYGDFLKNYVKTVEAPPPNSSEYNKLVPYLRWICKSPNDASPTVTTAAI